MTVGAWLDEPAAFLVRGSVALEVVRHNSLTGAVTLRTERGSVYYTFTSELADYGCAPARGFVRKSFDGPRVRHEFLNERKEPFGS